MVQSYKNRGLQGFMLPQLQGPMPVKDEFQELKIILSALAEYFKGLSGLIGDSDKDGKRLLKDVLGGLRGVSSLVDSVREEVGGELENVRSSVRGVKEDIRKIKIPPSINKTFKTDEAVLRDIKNLSISNRTEVGVRTKEITDRIDGILEKMTVEIGSLKDLKTSDDEFVELVARMQTDIDKSFKKGINALGKEVKTKITKVSKDLTDIAMSKAKIKDGVKKTDLTKLKKEVVAGVKPLKWDELEVTPTRDNYGFIQKWTVKKA